MSFTLMALYRDSLPAQLYWVELNWVNSLTFIQVLTESPTCHPSICCYFFPPFFIFPTLLYIWPLFYLIKSTRSVVVETYQRSHTQHLFHYTFMFFSHCLCILGVVGFALQRCSQCQRLHPGVWHLLCGELWIRQDDQTADSGAQVWSAASSASRFLMRPPRYTCGDGEQRLSNRTSVTGWQR